MGLADRRLLLVHAHPDDESIETGGIMAKYAAEGAQVTLVTCTLGEEGEVIPPALADLEGDGGRLAAHRARELAAACAALGVTDHRVLGGPGRWRDSGMMGTPANNRPGCFWRADTGEAVRELAAIVREVRPQVMVSYDEHGFYGHPDHIQAHRVARRAFQLSHHQHNRQGRRVAKFYATTVTRSDLARGIEDLRMAGTGFEIPASPAELPFGVPDEAVTTRIDTAEYTGAKLAAMRAHATQITVRGRFFALSNDIGRTVPPYEEFILLAGPLGSGSGRRGSEHSRDGSEHSRDGSEHSRGDLEDDLFAGIAGFAG